MANVTIKDVDENDLGEVARRAAESGMSTQEFLRRLIAREARRPQVPDQLAEIARRRRTGRRPMTMDDFARARTSAMRS